jgi:glycosyltransferase involved in cell wall biosynthesis
MKGVSGSENHLLTLLSALDKDRFDGHLCILVERQHIALLQEYARRLEKAGITVLFMTIRKYLNLSVVWRLRTYMLQEKFHIIHTHLIHADLYGTLAAKLAGVKTIISSRHNDDRFRNSLPIIWFNRFLARWQTKLIVISDWIGKFLQEVEGIPTAKIVRIHYGLDPKEIEAKANPRYVRQQFNIPESAPVIGTIGRCDDQKGQIYLLKAVRQIVESFPALRVLIIGDGVLRPELEQWTKEHGLADNMIFTGYRTDAIELLSGFDLFVFPSLWEGLGLVLLEAMALKKAIIASNVSAIPESVLDGKTGLLVPPKDVDALAGAIRKLLNALGLARTFGEAGYTHLQQEFPVKKMISTTEAVYLEVL